LEGENKKPGGKGPFNANRQREKQKGAPKLKESGGGPKRKSVGGIASGGEKLTMARPERQNKFREEGKKPWVRGLREGNWRCKGGLVENKIDKRNRGKIVR